MKEDSHLHLTQRNSFPNTHTHTHIILAIPMACTLIGLLFLQDADNWTLGSWQLNSFFFFFQRAFSLFTLYQLI